MDRFLQTTSQAFALAEIIALVNRTIATRVAAHLVEQR